MGKFADRLVAKMLLVALMLLVGIAALPGILMAAESVTGIPNQARKAQDPEKIQKAFYGLIQKAKAQQAQMKEWHRKAGLAKARVQAQEGQRVAKANGVTEAWRKFCQVRVAMLRTSEGVTEPVAMRVLDSCSTGTNFLSKGQ